MESAIQIKFEVMALSFMLRCFDPVTGVSVLRDSNWPTGSFPYWAAQSQSVRPFLLVFLVRCEAELGGWMRGSG